MVKTYVLAPNWTTAPPPDGPIKLGHVLDNLTEFLPLNREETIPIPTQHQNKTDTKAGFKTSRSKLISGELGVFGRIMGLVGIGAGAGIFYKKSKDDVLSCGTLDTMTFDPTAKYIAETMALDEIRSFMEGCRFKAPVYMITGLKIGRGASLQSSSSTDGGVVLEGGLQPPGSPVQVRGKAGVAVKMGDSESWTGSTDFIVAFRVRKIWYHRGDLRNEAGKDKVVMQDGAPVRVGLDMNLCEDDEVSLDEIASDTPLVKATDTDGEDVQWVFPDVAETETLEGDDDV